MIFTISAVLFLEQSQGEVKLTRNACLGDFAPTRSCVQSLNSSRQLHDGLYHADGKHFVQDIMCCVKGRERVN